VPEQLIQENAEGEQLSILDSITSVQQFKMQTKIINLISTIIIIIHQRHSEDATSNVLQNYGKLEPKHSIVKFPFPPQSKH